MPSIASQFLELSHTGPLSIEQSTATPRNKGKIYHTKHKEAQGKNKMVGIGAVKIPGPEPHPNPAGMILASQDF
jgi:hypothetical protein